jgi:hypothetical protein
MFLVPQRYRVHLGRAPPFNNTREDGTAVRWRQVVIMSVSVHSGEAFEFALVLVSMSHGKFILVELYIIKTNVDDRNKESRVSLNVKLARSL